MAKMESRMPDLIDTAGSVVTAAALESAVDERKLRSKQKFNLFVEETFPDQNSVARLEYDHATILLIKPTALFSPQNYDVANRKKNSSLKTGNASNEASKSAENAKKKENDEIEEDLIVVGEIVGPKSRATRKTRKDEKVARGGEAVDPSFKIQRDKSELANPNSSDENRVRRTSARLSGSFNSSPISSQNRKIKEAANSPERPVKRKRNLSAAKIDENDRQTTRSSRSSSLVRKSERNPKTTESAKKETKSNARSRSVSESRREAKRQKPKDDNDADSADEKPSKSSKPQQLRGVTGLKNLGNTCYLNTIVQVLASLKCFRDALKEVEFAVQSPTRSSSDESADGRSKRNRGVNSLTKSLQQLVGELNGGRRLTVEPSSFVQAVHDQLPNFNGHIQQDVQEFFCQLLYKLEKERTKGCSEDILNCVVNRMFTGQWQSEVICTQCSNSNLQIEKFNTLPLEFPNKYYKNTGSQNKNVSLDFLLKIYTKSERLGRVYNCENCRINQNYGRTRRQSVRTEADKRITVLESPKCLFVHLKRAKYSHTSGQEKIACHVDFPEKLNLTPYMTHKASSPEYVLRAVVVHHGKYFNSGHYTTFCYKDSEKKDGKSSGWVQYNDSEVTGATIADVLASQAYMLLYVDIELANEQDSS